MTEDEILKETVDNGRFSYPDEYNNNFDCEIWYVKCLQTLAKAEIKRI